jgi:hypothetical protein
MNLHNIAVGLISAINPLQIASLQISTGSITNSDGSRTPQYQRCPLEIYAQVQQLSIRDLRQLEGLNVAGSERKIYLNGSLTGTVRVSQKGGDLVTLQDGTVWLTTAVLEQWPDWCAVSVVLQNGS